MGPCRREKTRGRLRGREGNRGRMVDERGRGKGIRGGAPLQIKRHGAPGHRDGVRSQAQKEHASARNLDSRPRCDSTTSWR